MKVPLHTSTTLLLLNLLIAAISLNASDLRDPSFNNSGNDISELALQTPSIYFATPPYDYPCNEIGIYISNPNDQLSRVELYRSRNADSGFELLVTLNEGESYYSDQDLVSQKTYYYKARIIREGEVSAFSAVASTQSPYMMHDPIVTAVLRPDNTIEVSVQDRSYLDASYELYGLNRTDQVQTFSTAFEMLDSGRIYTVIDTLVEPGKTYSYHVNAYLQCDGQPYVGEWSSAAITIPQVQELPTVNSFTLVDYRTNQVVRELHDQDQFSAVPKFIIQANTNEETGSVEFDLNGEKYVDNEEPYALFDSKHADKNFRKLKAGDYVLRATAYSDDNLNGVEGNTLVIHFTVTRGATDKVVDAKGNEKVEVNVFPNPVTTKASIKISAPPGTPCNVQVIDQFAIPVISSNMTINNEGYFNEEWNTGNLRKGTYYVIVKMNNKTFTQRIMVK